MSVPATPWDYTKESYSRQPSRAPYLAVNAGGDRQIAPSHLEKLSVLSAVLLLDEDHDGKLVIVDHKSDYVPRESGENASMPRLSRWTAYLFTSSSPCRLTSGFGWLKGAAR